MTEAAPKRAARDTARNGGDAAWMAPAVRFGIVAYGVVHLVVAVLALQLALGERSGGAGGAGALATLAEQPFGRFVLWAVAAGMGLLVLWRLLDLLAGHRGEEGAALWGHRSGDLLTGAVYGVLGFAAARAATGGGGSSGSASDSLTARLLDLPGGQLLVGLVAAAIVGYAGALVRRGVSRSLADELHPEGRRGEAGLAYLALGRVGYVAKGAAVGVVGVLFGIAAVTHEADKSGGLGQALYSLLRQPFGPWLLGLVAVGIGCYGLFCFAQARHLWR